MNRISIDEFRTKSAEWREVAELIRQTGAVCGAWVDVFDEEPMTLEDCLEAMNVDTTAAAMAMLDTARGLEQEPSQVVQRQSVEAGDVIWLDAKWACGWFRVVEVRTGGAFRCWDVVFEDVESSPGRTPSRRMVGEDGIRFAEGGEDYPLVYVPQAEQYRVKG